MSCTCKYNWVQAQERHDELVARLERIEQALAKLLDAPDRATKTATQRWHETQR